MKSSVIDTSQIIENHNFIPKSLEQVPEKGKTEAVIKARCLTRFSCHFLESDRKRTNFKTKQIQSLLNTKISFNSRICEETTFTSRKGSTCKTEDFIYSCVNFLFSFYM